MTSAFAATAIALLALSTFAQGAEPKQTTPCLLAAPKYQTKGATAVFEISIECESSAPGAKPFPIATDLLVGLSVYSATDVKLQLRNSESHFVRRVVQAGPEVAAALKGAAQSKATLVSGQPKWIVLADEDADSHDITAKVVRVEKASRRVTVQFQTDDKSIAGKHHFLFAAWLAADRASCDKGSKYARSGCKRDGYVIGDGAGVAPIAAYPGLEINEFQHPSGDAWTSERWIVERFR